MPTLSRKKKKVESKATGNYMKGQFVLFLPLNARLWVKCQRGRADGSVRLFFFSSRDSGTVGRRDSARYLRAGRSTGGAPPFPSPACAHRRARKTNSAARRGSCVLLPRLEELGVCARAGRQTESLALPPFLRCACLETRGVQDPAPAREKKKEQKRVLAGTCCAETLRRWYDVGARRSEKGRRQYMAAVDATALLQESQLPGRWRKPDTSSCRSPGRRSSPPEPKKKKKRHEPPARPTWAFAQKRKEKVKWNEEKKNLSPARARGFSAVRLGAAPRENAGVPRTRIIVREMQGSRRPPSAGSTCGPLFSFWNSGTEVVFFNCKIGYCPVEETGWAARGRGGRAQENEGGGPPNGRRRNTVAEPGGERASMLQQALSCGRSQTPKSFCQGEEESQLGDLDLEGHIWAHSASRAKPQGLLVCVCVFFCRLFGYRYMQAPCASSCRFDGEGVGRCWHEPFFEFFFFFSSWASISDSSRGTFASRCLTSGEPCHPLPAHPLPPPPAQRPGPGASPPPADSARSRAGRHGAPVRGICLPGSPTRRRAGTSSRSGVWNGTLYREDPGELEV